MQVRDRVKGLRRVPAADLRKNPRNWRKHGEAQTAALRAMLSEIGFAGALLARELPDGSLELIDGHLRTDLTADATVPVLVLDLTEAESHKLLLTFDPIAAMAEADSAALKSLMDEWKTDNPALQALFDHTAKEYDVLVDSGAPLEEPPAQIDKAAEFQKKWGTKLGQIWEAGKQRLMCGDSTIAANLKLLWTDNPPGLMITDPPYGVNYNPAWRQGVGDWTVSLKQTGTVANDNRVDWTPAFQQSNCAVIYAWHSGIKAVETANALIGAGYEIRNQIIWIKSHFAMSRGDYHWQHEPCWYAVRKGTKSEWAGDRTQSTFWQISGLNLAGGTRDGNDVPTGHSTQKPVECMARPIRNHNFQSVFDPFCGSGTTLIAAHQLNRIGYGIEIDPGYVAVTLERLSLLGLTPKLINGPTA